MKVWLLVPLTSPQQQTDKVIQLVWILIQAMKSNVFSLIADCQKILKGAVISEGLASSCYFISRDTEGLLYGNLLCISFDGTFQEPVWAVVDRCIAKQRWELVFEWWIVQIFYPTCETVWKTSFTLVFCVQYIPKSCYLNTGLWLAGVNNNYYYW